MSQVGVLGGNGPRPIALPSCAPTLQLHLQRESTAYGWRVMLLTVILIRATVFVAGVLSVATVHSANQVDVTNASGNAWMAFDSHFYRYNMLYGYPAGPEIPYQIAYFPFFSLASGAILPICRFVVGPGAAPQAAMLTVANGCTLVGLCFLYAWARSLLGARKAFIAATLLSVYPGAVFFCAGLTEGPFMMFVAIVIYLLYKQRLYSAAAVSALATACRPTAISIAVVIVFWTIRHSCYLPKRQLLLRVLLIGMLSSAGAISYECFLWHRYHHINAFKMAEDKWDLDRDPIESPKNQQLLNGVDQKWTFDNSAAHPIAAPVQVQTELRRYSPAFFADRLMRPSAWNRLIAFGLLVILIGAFIRPAGVPRILFILPLVIFVMSYLPNWGLRCSSIFRYESAGFPLFVVLAIWLSTPSRRPLLFVVGTASMVLQLYYAFLFSRGFWVG